MNITPPRLAAKRKRAKSITWKGIVAGFVNSVILQKIGVAICRLMVSIGRNRQNYIYRTNDYFRVSSLELVAHEIYEKI